MKTRHVVPIVASLFLLACGSDSSDPAPAATATGGSAGTGTGGNSAAGAAGASAGSAGSVAGQAGVAGAGGNAAGAAGSAGTATGGSAGATAAGAAGASGAAGATLGPNSVNDGTTTYDFTTVGVTISKMSAAAGYSGLTGDFLHGVNLGAPAKGTNPCTGMAYSNNGKTYSSAYGASTCSVTVTTHPVAVGDHFTGTYTATLFQQDAVTSVTIAGNFDGVFSGTFVP